MTSTYEFWRHTNIQPISTSHISFNLMFSRLYPLCSYKPIGNDTRQPAGSGGIVVTMTNLTFTVIELRSLIGCNNPYYKCLPVPDQREHSSPKRWREREAAFCHCILQATAPGRGEGPLPLHTGQPPAASPPPKGAINSQGFFVAAHSCLTGNSQLCHPCPLTSELLVGIWPFWGLIFSFPSIF